MNLRKGTGLEQGSHLEIQFRCGRSYRLRATYTELASVHVTVCLCNDYKETRTYIRLLVKTSAVQSYHYPGIGQTLVWKLELLHILELRLRHFTGQGTVPHTVKYFRCQVTLYVASKIFGCMSYWRTKISLTHIHFTSVKYITTTDAVQLQLEHHMEALIG